MNGFRDIHSHFVYGVDDGAQTREEMTRMLDAAHGDGITRLFATAHVTPGVYPFDEAAYRRHLEEARRYCREMGYPMRLYSGAEILYTPAIHRYALEQKLPVLGNTDTVLVEFAPDVPFTELRSALELLTRSGYAVIVAHIERYRCMYFGNAFRLKERFKVRYQLNCGSFVNGLGLTRGLELRLWLRRGIIDYVASDAHNCESRPFRMRAAYQALRAQYGEAYAVKLTGLR